MSNRDLFSELSSALVEAKEHSEGKVTLKTHQVNVSPEEIVSIREQFNMSSVSEKDWKLFRKLQVELTSKACDLVFKKVENITNNRGGKEHQSYLDLYRLIGEEDAKIAEMFNNPTRNNVLMKIVFLKKYGVLSDDQLHFFSEETQEFVSSLLEE